MKIILRSIKKQKEICYKNYILTDNLFKKYGVKRGMEERGGKAALL